jgi:hypothetical protein
MNQPDNRPRIAVSTRWVDGKMEIGSLPLDEKGLMLKRCGKIYYVDPKGVQHRVADGITKD